MKKLIDLDESTKRTLAVKAAKSDKSLKKYIEDLCINDANKK